jgi:hypothetical protein
MVFDPARSTSPNRPPQSVQSEKKEYVSFFESIAVLVSSNHHVWILDRSTTLEGHWSRLDKGMNEVNDQSIQSADRLS